MERYLRSNGEDAHENEWITAASNYWRDNTSDWTERISIQEWRRRTNYSCELLLMMNAPWTQVQARTSARETKWVLCSLATQILYTSARDLDPRMPMDYAIEEENAITAKLGQWKMLTNDGRTIIDGSKLNKPRERVCKQIESATGIEWNEVKHDEKQRKRNFSRMKNRRKEKQTKYIKRIPIKVKWKSPETRIE